MRAVFLIIVIALLVGSAVRIAAAQSSQSAQQPPSTPPDSAARSAIDVRALLAPGRHAADIMELQHQPRVAELSAKLTKAVQQDTQFFRQYLSGAGAGGAVPWHPKMGLTEAEYREYLFLARQVIPRKIGETVLTVRADGGRLVIDAGERVPALRQVVIHVDSDFVRTTLGELTERSEVRSDEMQSLAGRWTGVRWAMAPGLGAAISLTIGKMAAAERGVLLSEMRYVDEAGWVGSLTTMLFYDLEALPADTATVKKAAPKKPPPRRPARRPARKPAAPGLAQPAIRLVTPAPAPGSASSSSALRGVPRSGRPA